ncbi:hypothetical protein JXD38_09120, partial [candidate division WOR-3 bacterium]|nr:hypothetical protein [candidate division WOR-3 bacterium]
MYRQLNAELRRELRRQLNRELYIKLRRPFYAAFYDKTLAPSYLKSDPSLFASSFGALYRKKYGPFDGPIYP